MSLCRVLTQYRMKLAPDLDSRDNLLLYIDQYPELSATDTEIAELSDGLWLYVSFHHPHSSIDVADFETYLHNYYRRAP